jgi:diaminopimelate decarboxylase
MSQNRFPLDKFQTIQTPFYYYDMGLLEQTLTQVKNESSKYGFVVHYAIKANANPRILDAVRRFGFGVDCVSGYEVQKALDTGFNSSGIVFAGVGKSDWEIELGIDNDIACFNVESVPELEVINAIAAAKGKVASVALRINPNVNAHTHHYITTGLEENKFGINQWDLEKVVAALRSMKNVHLEGIHFHIGSQITDLTSFKELCVRANELQEWFVSNHLSPRIINVGGGLGIDYYKPEENPVPDFTEYFKLFKTFLKVRPDQEVHFELGRSLVGQSGNLITKVLYVKEGVQTRFAIVDAGMTDLIRPALYQAYHKIENLSSQSPEEKYDVVGPICESSDCFGKALTLPRTTRGDFLAIRSAGAYGEIMASQYNLREIPKAYYSDTL